MLEEGPSVVSDVSLIRRYNTGMVKKTQIMYQPAQFKGAAERVMKDVDPEKIWLWLAFKEHEVCKRIMRTKNEDIVADILLENKAKFLRQNQNLIRTPQDAPTTSGKGKGKGNSKGGDKGNGKGGKSGKATRTPQVMHVPTMGAFKRADGKPMLRIQYEEMNNDSEGVLVATLDEYAEKIWAMEGEHLPNAMAFLLFVWKGRQAIYGSRYDISSV